MRPFDQVWWWRRREVPGRAVDRKGQRCRILARCRPGPDSMNSILVEFEDGYKVVTSRYAVRLAKEPGPQQSLFEARS